MEDVEEVRVDWKEGNNELLTETGRTRCHCSVIWQLHTDGLQVMGDLDGKNGSTVEFYICRTQFKVIFSEGMLLTIEGARS